MSQCEGACGKANGRAACTEQKKKGLAQASE